MPVGRGVNAGRFLLTSFEVALPVRAPHEVRRVSVDEGLRSTTFGGVNDTEFNTARIAGDPQRLSMSAEWRASGSLDDIRGDHNRLRQLSRHNPALGRPPIVRLSWAHLEIEGYVTELRVIYLDGVFLTPPHLPRAFRAELTVSRVRPRSVARSQRFIAETTFRTISAGETLESVAFDAYGDPDLGNVLRRHNPQLSLDGEVDGDTVRILDTDDPRLRDTPEPVSPALGGNVDALLQQFADERLGRNGPGITALEEELGL